MADSTVVVGVTGIIVSGVIGPTVAAWMARGARSREFHRDHAVELRDQLRTLLDEAAGFLATGATNLRVLREAGPDSDDVKQARNWLAQVFPIAQRLQLWLPSNHAVVVAYEGVREQLLATAEAGDGADSEGRIERFEHERANFLEVCRKTLLSPIPERGAAL